MSKIASFGQDMAKAETVEGQQDPRRFDRGSLERLARVGSQLFDVDLCVALMPWEPHWIRPLGEKLESEAPTFSRRFGRHDAMIVPDARACAQLKHHTLVAGDPGIRFIAYASIVLDDTKGPLSLFLADREPRTWTDDRLHLFADFLALSEDVLVAELTGQEVTALAEENRQLRKLATVDHLTGLWNRNSILDILDRELERCSRQKLPISLIVADLDRFKDVNDCHGHVSGDAVLKATGQRLRRAVRSYDAVGRFGGDEFLIVMSDCDEVMAAAVAERVQEAIRKSPVETGAGQIRITISQGLVTHMGPGKISRLHLFDQADQALYLAKTRGRDGIQRDTDVPPRSAQP